jgi:hypothetical protein
MGIGKGTAHVSKHYAHNKREKPEEEKIPGQSWRSFKICILLHRYLPYYVEQSIFFNASWESFNCHHLWAGDSRKAYPPSTKLPILDRKPSLIDVRHNLQKEI